ncbi:hypothetical protein FHS00_001572 [Limimaricola variabilis]|uniref:Uncharacterized protein n=1 Tax=Limimaricola variabilis TaxID=1492771 RepID=A0ABR6HN61_9RHOB|nr:hypothetical protein [Limimaricola variabilis]MBB3711996.1 hypothetical protein [Limimaricola variabilis]
MRALRHLPPLAHVALLAGFGLALDWSREPPMALVSARPQTGDAAPSAPGDRLFAFSGPRDYGDRLQEVAERPLFVHGRGKAVASAPPPAERPPETALEAPVQIFVRGTMVDAGGGQALLDIPDGEGEVWVRLGDSIAGWRVEEILVGSIRLSRDGENRTVRLFE